MTIKGSNDALYNGAQVSIVYYADGDLEETFLPIQTTGANGVVTISYPANASYAQMFITPPVGDLTNAVQTIDLLTSSDAAITNVKLKAANIRVKTLLPSGEDSGLNTCVDIPKAPSSRWITTQYRTTRTGAFGIAIPSTLNPVRDYHIGLNPCNKKDYNYLGMNYGLRRASNGNITIYTDDQFKTVATATNGVYSLKFDQGKVRGQIFDADGNPFTLQAGTYIYLEAFPITSSGEVDQERHQLGSTPLNSENKFTFYGAFQEGKYRIYVRSHGNNPIPGFAAGNIWVDSSLKYSTSETGTYTSTLDLAYNLPNTGLTKFQFVDASGNPFAIVGNLDFVQLSGGTKSKSLSLSANINGLASGKIDDGEYGLYVNPQNTVGLQSNYTLSVVSGVTTLRNSNNEIISKVNGIYPVVVPTPNLKIQMVSPYDTTSAILSTQGSIFSANGEDQIGSLWNETKTSVSLLKLNPGSYLFTIYPYSNENPLSRNTFTIDVDTATTTIRNGTTVIQPFNGIYKLAATKPVITGQVLNPAGTETVRWADVRVRHATNPKLQFYASTNSAGDFTLDLGSPIVDGNYFVTANPPLGLNANFGLSESVTINVTNGVPNIASLSIRLRSANVSGVVSGPSGPSPENWLIVQESRTGVYLEPTFDGPLTDADGGYSLYLPTGAYGITPSSDYSNTGGVANGAKACVVGANAATPVTCNISLISPNVSGTITIGGEKPAQAMVGFAPPASDPLAQKIFASKKGGTLWSGWSDVNNYGLQVDSGTYRMWIAYQTYTGEQTTIPGPLCVVPETGTVTCNASMPATNLKIQVSDWNGGAIRSDVSAAIQYKDGTNYFWTCCATSDPTLRDGKIQVGLIQGSYKVELLSSENLSNGTNQTYYFDVDSSSAVVNMRLTESGTALTSVSGVFSLRLKEPVITGVLYGTNGSTPEPYREVRLFNASGNFLGEARTDRLGRFAFSISESLANGTYFIVGLAQQSITVGNSKFESFTVTNGKATTSLSIRLQAPNVIGTASGPSGVSKGSYVYAQAQSSSSIFAREQSYTFTDQQGKFAFYLPTGTYKFWGEANLELTGGVSGYSQTCTVNAETSTPVTCNLTFESPNATGTLSTAGVRATNSYVLFFPAYGITGNTAVNSYGWINTSNGKYGIKAEAGTYRTFQLTYPANGKAGIVTPGPLCIVPTTGSVTCNLTYPSPNFTFKMKSFSGNDVSTDTNYTLEIKNGDQYQSASSNVSYAGASTSLSLVDGSYKFRVNNNGNKPSDGSPATFAFEVINGVVSNLQRSDSTTVIAPISGVYFLQLVKPNVSGNVAGPKGVSPDTYVEVRKLRSDGGADWTEYSAITDSSGNYSLNLPVGIYLLKARPDYVATGGSETSIRCEVTSETNTAITCNIALTAPNVTGTVRIGGVTPAWGDILLRPASGVAGNTATDWYGWNSLNAGVFGIKAKPGTYRIHTTAPVDNKWQLIPAGLCVVPETGTVTCNVNLPTANFVMSVLDTNGNELSRAGIEVGAVNGDTWDALCCDSINPNTKRKAFSLIDGRYRIRIWPQDGKDGSQIYFLTIESGTVKSLRANGSTSEVLSIAGAFPLQLKPPTFVGAVYKSDGTPAPYTQVCASSEKGGWCAQTGADARFVIDIDSSIQDANFTFIATPNRYTYQTGVNIDKSQGSSAPRIESVTAGVGSQIIQLNLRRATINGRVLGAKAALINRDITFQKLDGAGNWNWTNINAYTDKNGDFAEYLPSGTYRIFSWGDTKGAGGGETYGNSCIVNTDSSTATICNLTLVAPNVSGTAKLSGINIDWGQVEFTPDLSISTEKSRRSYWTNIDSGSFGGNMQADTYQMSIWYSSNGKYNRVFGPKCVVPETGTVTCNINLPGINLSYRVLDNNNSLLTSNVYSSLEVKTGDTWIWSCCSHPDQNLRDGKFEASLIDGNYRLGVRPDNASVAGSTQNYLITVESGTVKNFIKENSIDTLTAVNGLYTTKLRAAALSGTVYKLDGSTAYANARVCARPQDQNYSWWRICTGSNQVGKFTFDQNSITDSTWIVQAFSTGDDLTQGSSIQDSVTVVSGIGSKALSLVLRAPTLTGAVTGPLGASPNNYINVRKYYDNGGYDYVDVSFKTDSQGRFAFTLEPGRYRVQANTDMAVAGGTSATSADCIVTAGNTTTCNINLIAPNVTGTVKIAGQITSASVELIKETNYGYDYLGYSSGTNQVGSYWLNVAPGTYRTRLYLYASGNWMLGPPCVVQAGVNATCDINLPATNFQFKVNKASGALATSGVNVTYYLNNNDRLLWAGNASTDKEGMFKSSLVDGTYFVEVNPNGSDSTIGTYVRYIAKVESGTVTSLTLEKSTTQLVATSNVYTLTLGAPSIAGTVVAPDGTTPVPDSYVIAFGDAKGNYGANADKNAAFGFAKLPDGTYSVVATPGYGDATKAPSAPTQVKVLNGVGASDLRLTLRTPNVSGVVRGPTSKVSPNNWLNVEQKMGGGWWKQPDYFTGVATSVEGSFGLYLDPGVYRISARGDMNVAGGVATTVICTVPNTGTVTCNITLKAPNLKIRVVAPGQSTWNQGSWAWTYLQSTSNEDAITNRNPSFEWDQNGTYQVVLEDGTWMVRTEGGNNPLYSNTQFVVEVSNGVVTKVTNANNETLTATAGVYYLPLISSNLTGTIAFNGVQYDGGATVTVLRQDGEYWNHFTSKWTSSGTFGFTVPAGNYKVEVIPYWNNQNIEVSTTRSELCIVEATGTTTCNVALKAPNLRAKITDRLGGAFRFSEAYILMQQGANERWLRWLNLRDGIFNTYLEDGTYRIQVMPYWEYRATYTDRSYIVKVESGTVTSITDINTLSILTPIEGLYSLALGTPSVTGKVYNPGSSIGAPFVQIQVAPSSSPKYWRYSAQSDANGNFALTVPNGTYVIQAVPTNGGFQFGKSETRTITINGGVLSGLESVTLVLRNPNFTGRVVTPGANPVALANVNVNIYIDGEYFYGWTDSDGRFGAYVDNQSPQCPSRCSINLNYYKSSEYTPRYHQVSAIGNQGDLAIGGVTSKLTVLVPQISGTPLPSKYSWVSVQRIYDNGTTSWVTSGNTNENGVVGLTLDTGIKYRIWAYPNGEQSAGFAPKSLDILSYSPETHAVLTLTFNQPNIKLRVLSTTGGENTFGWYTVSTWDSATSTATQISNASLDNKGLSALTLADGDYQLRFFPGKGAKGVQKVFLVRISGSTITAITNLLTGESLASSLLTVKLPGGNISGFIQNSAGSSIASALVAAYRADDSTKFVTTSSDTNGYYELNLDLTYSWIVRSVDPVSGYSGATTIASRVQTNEVLSNQNVSLSTAP